MFSRFTERARQVVVLAQEEARILKHNYIGTEHILLGLLREEEGIAARVLESLEIVVERVRVHVVRIVGSGEEVAYGQIPFTPRAKKVLELAMREALSLGHNYIGTEHILLGLVRENEGVAARILLDFDADSEKIRTEVVRMLSRPGAGRLSIGQAALSPGIEATVTLPGRSGNPRLDALARTNRIRVERARLKRDMKSGRRDPAELFLDPPTQIQTATVFDLLLAVPRWGRHRATRALAQLGISAKKTVGALTERERLALAELLRRPPQEGSASP